MPPMFGPMAGLGIALTAILCAFGAGPGHAAELGPETAWDQLEVGILPLTFLPTGGETGFGGREAGPGELAAARWQGHLERLLGGRDEVRVHGLTGIRQRLADLPQLQRTAALAFERFQLGLSRWRNLQAKDALTDLERARALYLEAFADMSAPTALADVELQRGLVLRELGDAVAADLAFRQLFALDPGRRIQHGYYDAATERALAEAARDVAQRPNPLAAMWELERLQAASKLLGIEVWAFGVVMPTTPSEGRPSELALHVMLVDLRTGRDARLIDVTVGVDERAALDRLDRELSAWHTCALEARGGRTPRRAKQTWDVELGYVHSVWLRHRETRDYLHGPGAEIGVAWHPTPGLELYARTAQIVTLTDANSDLLDGFTVTRTTLGAGLTVEGGGVQFTLRAGIDLALSLSDIDTTTDVDCKFFGATSKRCGGIFRAKVPAVWLGFDFAAAFRFRPARTWFIAFTVGAASYVFAPEASRELNFPLYGSLGFGLPF